MEVKQIPSLLCKKLKLNQTIVLSRFDSDLFHRSQASESQVNSRTQTTANRIIALIIKVKNRVAHSFIPEAAEL